jgi:hypothetical protein
VSTLDDRRQSAREAAHDEIGEGGRDRDTQNALEAAIETATRVDITPDMVEIVRQLDANGMISIDACRRGLVDVFRAAGFEVER